MHDLHLFLLVYSGSLCESELLCQRFACSSNGYHVIAKIVAILQTVAVSKDIVSVF
jgi:hypothetical protein